MVGQRVYVAIVTHMYGDDVLVSATEEGVEGLVHGWVIDNWDRDAPTPSSQPECLAVYFDGSNGASYSVEECLIHP